MTAPMHLNDSRVAMAGDWHGNTAWATRMIRTIHQTDPTVTTVLHLGDFWPHPTMNRALDKECHRAGIERILVTLGNHEPWGVLRRLMQHGQPPQLSEVIHVLPRPYRFTIAGREILSLGGAASVDRDARVEDYDWWPDERITEQMAADAIAGGPADIMLTHESPEGTPVRSVQNILATNPFGFTPRARSESLASRQTVTRVWDAVNPKLLAHGHMHAPGEGATGDGRRVLSLGCDGQPRNVILLDVGDLTITNIVHG